MTQPAELRMSVHQRKRALVYQLLAPYMQAKRDRGMVAQYGRLKPGKDGRIRTEPNPIGTSTGRFSSGESNLDEASTNLQNLAKKVAAYDELYQLRDVIVAEPGMKLWASDYTGAEALLAAAYQGDWDMYEMILSGRNVHAWHGHIIFGWPEETFKKEHPAEYVICKNMGYGGQYYASVWKMTQVLNGMAEQTGRRFTQAEVAAFRLEFMKIHPWEQWWYNVRKELAENDNATRNAFGFRRGFYHPDADKRLKEALANYPQSTVASLISEVMIDMYDWLDYPGRFELRLQVHDELLGVVRADRVAEYAPKVKELMERRFVVNGREIYIPAGFAVGDTWGSMQEYEVQEHI